MWRKDRVWRDGPQSVCSNKDYHQCSLSLVVNSGSSDLASRLGTNGLIKTINNKVRCMKNWNMIGFVLFACHIFSPNSIWSNLLFILWFFIIFYNLKAGLYLVQGTNWWFLIWPQSLRVLLMGRMSMHISWFLSVVITHDSGFSHAGLENFQWFFSDIIILCIRMQPLWPPKPY